MGGEPEKDAWMQLREWRVHRARKHSDRSFEAAGGGEEGPSVHLQGFQLHPPREVARGDVREIVGARDRRCRGLARERPGSPLLAVG